MGECWTCYFDLQVWPCLWILPLATRNKSLEKLYPSRHTSKEHPCDSLNVQISSNFQFQLTEPAQYQWGWVQTLGFSKFANTSSSMSAPILRRQYAWALLHRGCRGPSYDIARCRSCRRLCSCASLGAWRWWKWSRWGLEDVFQLSSYVFSYRDPSSLEFDQFDVCLCWEAMGQDNNTSDAENSLSGQNFGSQSLQLGSVWGGFAVQGAEQISMAAM